MKQFHSRFHLLSLLVLILSVTLALVACTDQNNDDAEENTTSHEETTTTDPLQTKSNYSVAVCDTNGAPILGATVQFSLNGSPVCTATTNAQGIATAFLEEASYSVTVITAEGFICDGETYTFQTSFAVAKLTLNGVLGSTTNPEYISEDVGSVSVTTDQYFYIGIMDPNGKKLVVNNTSAIVVYDEEEYLPDKNGIINIHLKPKDATDSKKPTLIGFRSASNSVTAISFSLEYLPGSIGAPLTLETLDSITATPVKNAPVYYHWTATANGTLKTVCDSGANNIILNVESRTSDPSNGKTSTTLSVLKGETVTICIGTLSSATAGTEMTVSFELDEAPQDFNFTYRIQVSDNAFHAITNVTVQIYDRTDSALPICTVITDADGLASFEGPLNKNYYAKILLPEDYTAANDKTESEFVLSADPFGILSASFVIYND